jgi:hypothetical protein
MLLLSCQTWKSRIVSLQKEFCIFPLLLSYLQVTENVSVKRIENVTKVSALSAFAVSFTQSIKFFAVPELGQVEN